MNLDEEFDETEYIVDRYEHSDEKIFYTVTRIPGKDILESEFNHIETGCNCLDSQCTIENNCSCLKYGSNYRLSNDGLVLEDNKFGNVPIFECNLHCSCFEKLKKMYSRGKSDVSSGKVCQNRNVQLGPIDCLEIFDAGRKGLGIKTVRKISRGSFICEYAGEVISLEEAKRRQKDRRGKMNFVFVLREYSGDVLCKVTCVDPGHVGNVGRYINHSCQPNSAVVPIRVNDTIPWLCVFALRNIEADEEICYDYSGLEMSEADDDAGNERKPCYCGTTICKKFLPYRAEL